MDFREHHDAAVCRDGTFDIAVAAIKEAVSRGFRVTTKLHFLRRELIRRGSAVFRCGHGPGCRRHDDFTCLPLRKGARSGPLSTQTTKQGSLQTDFWRILIRVGNSTFAPVPPLSPSKIEYDCTPWGMPTYNIFGWQKPCYLLQDGYAGTFVELMETTAWENYGAKSGNSKCTDCMVHSGYEASAVNDTFGSLAGFARTVKATLFPLEFPESKTCNSSHFCSISHHGKNMNQSHTGGLTL